MYFRSKGETVAKLNLQSSDSLGVLPEGGTPFLR